MTPLRIPVKDAILEAALQALARDPRASLGSIAEQAGVGRATLHRHFQSRFVLVRALALQCVREIDEAVASVTGDATSALDLLERIIRVVVPFGDRFHFLALEGRLVEDDAVREATERQRHEYAELVGAVQQEGAIDPALPVDWVVSVIDSLTYAAWTAVAEGRLTTSDASALVLRTLLHGVAGAETRDAGTERAPRSDRS